MWKRYVKIVNFIIGLVLLALGVKFNLTSEIINVSHSVGLLFVGTGLILLVGFVRNKTT